MKVFFSSEIQNLNVSVTINAAYGLSTSLPNYCDLFACPIALFENRPVNEIRLECSLQVDEETLCGPICSKYISHHEDEADKVFNERIRFPLKYSEVSESTVVFVLLRECFSPTRSRIIASCGVSLFKSNFLLRTGKLCLQLETEKSNEKGLLDEQERKIGTSPYYLKNNKMDPYKGEETEFMKFENILQMSQRCDMKRRSEKWMESAFPQSYEKILRSQNGGFLEVEFPKFSHPVVYVPESTLKDYLKINDLKRTLRRVAEPFKELGEDSKKQKRMMETMLGELLESFVLIERTQPFTNKKSFTSEENSLFFEKMFEEDPPPMDMYFKLTLSMAEPVSALPTKYQREALEKIQFKTSIDVLKAEEKILLWTFRHYLSKDRNYLTKFLLSIDWKNSKMEAEALKALHEWEKIKMHDILQLLSFQFKGNYHVREFAVRMLQQEDTEEEKVYNVFLQLVQALRYETKDMNESALGKFLLKLSRSDIRFATKLYWHLNCEKDDIRFVYFQDVFMNNLESKIRDQVLNQIKLFALLSSIQNEIVERRIKNASQRKEFLQNRLEEQEKALSELFPMFLPVDPRVTVTGIEIEKIRVFQSGSYPFLLPFITDKDDIFYTIYKEGDDMRQDQLIVQILIICDSILKKNNIFPELTPYEVIATSERSGMLHCILPNSSLHKIFKTDSKSIKSWLSEKNEKMDDYNLAVQNYNQSLATYVTLTYVLGIGDRHLDNILLQPNGKLFHVDFGYILGARQFFEIHKPVIKLNEAMVEPLGEIKGGKYRQFLLKCCELYNVIRKHSSLFINMFLLMVDSKIKDILDYQHHGTATFNKIRTLQEKLRIGDSNQLAEIFLVKEILRNQSCFGGRVEDFTHWIAMR